jgi:hypothetical protein
MAMMRRILDWFAEWLAALDARLPDDHVQVIALRNAAVRAWEVRERDVYVVITPDETTCIVRHVDNELGVEVRGVGAYSAALGALISWNGKIVSGMDGVIGVSRRDSVIGVSRRPAGSA